MSDLLIKNGNVVLPVGIMPATIAIEGGRIAAIGSNTPAKGGKRVIDAAGLYVLPGLVDDHVHFRDPGLTDKEDIPSGSRSAAAGGVTTVLDMPNTIPPVATAEAFIQKRGMIGGRSYVDIGLYGVITEDNLDHLVALAEHGAIGYKLFMGETTGYIRCPQDAEMLQAFRKAAQLGLRVGAHAENDALLQYIKQRLIDSGRRDPIAHLESRPASAEHEAILRGILLSEQAGNDFHVFHLSTAQGLEQLCQAKQRGLPVSCEVLVGHLMFTDEDYTRLGNRIRLNPPIRPACHQSRLWEGLQRGWIDAIATDHAPHTYAEKTAANVWDVACGFIGVETSLPLMLTQVLHGKLTLQQYVRAACENPARIWGLYPRKGVIQIGSDADLVLIDMQAQAVIREDQLHNKNRFTPYEGQVVQGIPRFTILRGNVIMEDGEVLDPPRGQFTSRNGSDPRMI